MLDLEEKIAKIQAEIRKTPYHKGTEHHIGLLKAKLAKLRSQLVEKGSKKGVSAGFAIPKQGDATCVLVGLPSVGKSTLLAKLTAAKPKIAPYPFTTLTVIPGMMNYQGAKIQILDVPGIVGGAAAGVGRGREVLSIARVADLLIIVAEAVDFEAQKTQVISELEDNGVRVQQTQPKIKIKKLSSGGLKIVMVENSALGKDQISSIAKELGLVNAEIQIKEKVTQDELIDTILGNRVYLPAIFVSSKADLVSLKPKNGAILLSAVNNLGFEKLKEEIWKKLGLIRVYLKPVGQEVDFDNPLILKFESKILEAAEKISTNLAQNLKSTQVFRGNLKKQVGVNFELEDEDIITFIT